MSLLQFLGGRGVCVASAPGGVHVEYIEHTPPTLDMLRWDIFGRELVTWGRPQNNIDRLTTRVEELMLGDRENQAGVHTPRNTPDNDSVAGGVTAGMGALSLSHTTDRPAGRADARPTPSEYRCRSCGNVFSMKKTLVMHSKVCV